MIIRTNGMNPSEVQKQINDMSKFKRGFNQSPEDIRNGVNGLNKKPSEPIEDPRKKIQAMQNIQRFNK